MSRDRALPPSEVDELRRNLERLRLKVMLACLDEAIDEATRAEQGYAAFLAGLVHKEMLARQDAAAERRVGAAKFAVLKTFDTFNWTFQPGLNVPLVKDLMSLRFVAQGRPVLMLGRPGTGKSHISIALGVLAAQRGYTVRFFSAPRLIGNLYAALADNSIDPLVARLARIDLLIIDDIREMPLKIENPALLFELIEARCGRKATIISSNLPVSAWGKALGSPTLVAPMVDRMMERAYILNIKQGRSYRSEGPDAPPADDRPPELRPSALPE